ncbi:Glycerol-3-phosphate phosphatase [Lamellibrachia satsuma]|nr:Glycerol-3-phosphate phosphatase [Lamellibrachia satsuma]
MTDCDGVLWKGNHVIPGTQEAIEKLRKLGKKVLFVTNNSTKTRAEYVKKCASLGFTAQEDEIIGSSYVTAQYIKHTLKYTGKVYIVGPRGLAQELDAVGIPNFGAGPDLLDTLDDGEFAKLPLDPEVKCVVVGFDRDFNYVKLCRATAYLRRKGCIFVATNTDTGLPMNDRFIPGTGTMVAAVAEGAERQPDVICGKPHQPIFDTVKELHKADPKRCVMIGDRLNTDIELVHNCGLGAALLVLTGCSTLEEVRQKQSSNSIADQRLVPHFYLPSLAQLGPLIDTLK